MSFAKAPPRLNHVLLPKRDRTLESAHTKVRDGTRGPRPATKPHSAGALAKATWSRRPSEGHLTVPSETRRPRGDSPFARINLLKREQECPENQAIEVGPARRLESTVADNNDFRRGHILGAEASSFKGIHWSKVSNYEATSDRPVVRKSLLREMQDAPQHLEWLQAHPPPGYEERDYSRRNVLAREAKEDEDRHLDQRPQAVIFVSRNVLTREVAKDGDTANMPRPAAIEAGGAPVFIRPRTLVKVKGLQ
ncbi:NHP2-like protein 1 [Durusdinium trenchii]|uniref:NHP2-like protein 1 n=1 Tax=Durusdinium trenchii TaxID=1381693 RepID=A0ABP0HHI0_9DINO